MDTKRVGKGMVWSVFILAVMLFSAGCGLFGGSSSDDDNTSSSSSSTDATTAALLSKLTGSLAVENNTTATTSKPVRNKSGQVVSAREAATTACTDYRIYFIPVSTGVQGDSFFSLTANTTTGGCDITGTLPDAGVYDVKLFSESTSGSGTYDVEEAIVQLGVTVEASTAFQATICFDEALKIVNVEMIKIDSDGNRTDVPKTGNIDVTEIAAFPDISGVYTVQFKRTEMDNFQQGTEDAIEGNNDGGWEESFYVGVYEGNLVNRQTYQQIAGTNSKRMSVWVDKSYRDGCYAANSSSDVIASYSMQDSASGNVLSITSATTSDDLYTFMEANEWIPAALLADQGSAQTVDDEIDIDCGALMPLLKPFYAGATVDAETNYCTTLLTGAQGVALTEVQTYLDTLASTERTMAATMLENMLFATNEGPPHLEWCRDFQLIEGNTTREGEFVNFMIGMCEMHTKGDESLMIKRDMVRQFFDIFAEVKREPRSDKKMGALADFIKINGITASKFATKMADDDILKTFLNMMAQMPCFDDGCKSWKRALKLALNNLAAFKADTLCDSFTFTENDFCFSFTEFTATSTTIDIEVTVPTSGSTTIRAREKVSGTWGGWSSPSVTASTNSYTIFDETGATQTISETNLVFTYSANDYRLGIAGDRPEEMFGDIENSSGQFLGVFGRKINLKTTASETVTTYRIKSGGGMAEQIDQMACSGGYHPVEFTSYGTEMQAMLALTVPQFDFTNGEQTFMTSLSARTDIGDWYQALVNLISSADLAAGCGQTQLKDSVRGIYWSFQIPGLALVVADPDDPQPAEISDVVKILNNVASNTPPTLDPGGSLITISNADWTTLRQNLIDQRQLMNVYWSVSSIRQELGFKRIKVLMAAADMGGGKNLEQLTAADMETFLAQIKTFDLEGHWSWIWGDEETSRALGGECFGPNSVSTCTAWTAARLAAAGMRGGTNLEDIKFRLRDARRQFALEEDETFRAKVNDIIANSQCIPDITFKDNPEIASDGTIKFKLNLRGPAFRIMDSELNFKKDSAGTVRYFISDANMEIHQADMNTTCVFGEKKEISNMAIPTLSSSKYTFSGLFLRAFFDGCGENKDLQDSESSSSSEQGSTADNSLGNDRFREVQSFLATQD